MSNQSKPNTPVEQFQFFTDTEYREDLSRRIGDAQAGARILLMSMTFDPAEQPIAELMTATTEAAKRGAVVSLGIDAHSFMIHRGLMGPLWYNSELPGELSPEFQQKRDMLDRINSFPTGQAVIINKPNRRFSIPVAGRSHIKIAIVGNYMYIGGCNLQDTDQADMMVGLGDEKTVSKVYGMLQQVIDRGSTELAFAGIDQQFALNDSSNILVDAGKRSQSLILGTALQLIDDADSTLFMSNQFFPNSVTADRLKEADKRGVNVDIIYSHPRHQGLLGGLGQQVSILLERMRMPDDFFAQALSKDDPMVHAKLLASEKAFMLSSHNYVKAGVLLGTAEISLQCTDAELAAEAVQTFKRSLAQKQAMLKN